MHSATEMLHRQIQDYSQAWRGGGAREAWEVEAWVETGLSIFRLIRTLDERRGGQFGVQNGSVAGGELTGYGCEVAGLYEEWLRNVAGALGRVAELEAAGCAVADAGEFRQAECEARGQLNLSLDAALRAGGAGECAAAVPEMGEEVGRQFPA